MIFSLLCLPFPIIDSSLVALAFQSLCPVGELVLALWQNRQQVCQVIFLQGWCTPHPPPTYRRRTPRCVALIDVKATSSPPSQLMFSAPCWASPTRLWSLLSSSTWNPLLWLWRAVCISPYDQNGIFVLPLVTSYSCSLWGGDLGSHLSWAAWAVERETPCLPGYIHKSVAVSYIHGVYQDTLVVHSWFLCTLLSSLVAEAGRRWRKADTFGSESLVYG